MNKSPKEKAAGKKGKKAGLILIIILLSFVIALGAGIAFNIAGLGVKVNNCMASLPITRNFFKPVAPAKSPQELEIERIENEKTLIEEERKRLEEFSNSLGTWELQLKAKESELNDKEIMLMELEERLEPRIKNIEELVLYYEKMDSADAVEIINRMSSNELIIVLLKNMKQQKSSEILAQMDPQKAARIIEMMSSQ
ncbi:MAG: hypothetical protein HPY66_0248 [Firmicutes bacterium]|nr:hypothetical protein [Bacillota bacterium]